MREHSYFSTSSYLPICVGSLVDLRFAPTNPVHAFQGRDHVLEWEPIGERIKDALGNESDLGYERQATYHPARTAIGSARSNQASSLGLTASDLTMQHLQRGSSPANSELHLDLFTPLLSRRRNVVDLRFDSKASFRDDIFHAWVERNDPADLGDGPYHSFGEVRMWIRLRSVRSPPVSALFR